MVDFISEIYYYSQLISGIRETIHHCYTEEHLIVRHEWADMQEPIIEFCKEIAKQNYDLGMKTYNLLENACAMSRNGNYNLMADALSEILPLMEEGIKLWGAIDVSENNYRLFSSKSGFLSLENTKSEHVYHSSTDPLYENYLLAKHLYKPQYTSYRFLGSGLGYLPWQIFCLSDQSADIYIYHCDPKIIEYALDYGVLSWIPSNKLHIVVEPSPHKLLDMFSSVSKNKTNTGYHCTMDLIDNVSGIYRDIVLQFDASNGTATLFNSIANINSHRNSQNVTALYTDFVPATKSDEWVVAVAGPSLDLKLDYLKECCGKKTIICASTILKKLLSNGIVPDCVAVLDPQSRTYGHFEGLEEHSVPLLLSSTANWRFGELYEGPKYIVPSLTSEHSISYYSSKKIRQLDIGTTVSSMAITLAIELGASKIDLVGLDLAYPNGASHASGTMDVHQENTANMQQVPCVAGGTVPTTSQFKIYISEIEEIISKHTKIKFINYSDLGTSFKGSVWYKNLK